MGKQARVARIPRSNRVARFGTILLIIALSLAACGGPSKAQRTATASAHLATAKAEACRSTPSDQESFPVELRPEGVRRISNTNPVRYGSEQLLQFSHDGSLLAVGSQDAVLIFDSTDLALRWRCPTGVPVHSIAFSPDSSLLMAGLENTSLPLWQTQDGALVRTITSPRQNTLVGFSPDGSLQVAAYGIWMYVWRTSDGVKRNDFVTRGYGIRELEIAATDDGPHVAIAVVPSGNNTRDAQPLEVWSYRLDDGSLVSQFTTTISGAAALSGPEPMLALLSPEGVVLWHHNAPQPQKYALQSPTGNTARSADTLTFSSDGTLIVAGAVAGTVLVWRVSDGVLLASYPARGSWITGVAISPDNRTLATLNHDGGLCIWQR